MDDHRTAPRDRFSTRIKSLEVRAEMRSAGQALRAPLLSLHAVSTVQGRALRSKQLKMYEALLVTPMIVMETRKARTRLTHLELD